MKSINIKEIKNLDEKLYNIADTAQNKDGEKVEYYIYPEIHNHYFPVILGLLFKAIGERYPQLEEAIERLKKIKAKLIEEYIRRYQITHVALEGTKSVYTITGEYKDLTDVLGKYNVEILYLEDIEDAFLDYEEREIRWIKKLSEIKKGRVLILCGKNHVFSLLRKLDKASDLPSIDPLYYYLLLEPIIKKLEEYKYNVEGYKKWLKTFLEESIREIREKEEELFEKYGIRID